LDLGSLGGLLIFSFWACRSTTSTGLARARLARLKTERMLETCMVAAARYDPYKLWLFERCGQSRFQGHESTLYLNVNRHQDTGDNLNRTSSTRPKAMLTGALVVSEYRELSNKCRPKEPQPCLSSRSTALDVFQKAGGNLDSATGCTCSSTGLSQGPWSGEGSS
jgi:hypothetical protein